jgi:hypothetical protein
MSPIELPRDLEAYVQDHTTAAPPYLQELAIETAALPRAGMLSGPVEGRLCGGVTNPF